MSEQTFPARADVEAVITALYVYPIKSCAGVAVDEAILTETGLEFDRAWMVVDEHGGFLTQRELPRMALIQPQLRHADMVLRAPGMLALHIALDQVESPARVQLWGHELAAYDMGKLAAQWFTDFLGQPARLVRFDPEARHLSSLTWTDGAEALNQFNDGYPVLLLSDASLANLNEKLAASGSTAVSMLRFRPNIVVGDRPGASSAELAPHDEDRLALLQIATGEGPAVFKPVKPCPRCPIPNVDPATALVSIEVGDMLQSYRQNPLLGGAISFGMNLIGVRETGGAAVHVDRVLRVGQSVQADYRFD